MKRIFLFSTAIEEASLTSEIFCNHTSDLSNVFASYLYEITDSLFSEKLVGQSVLQSLTTEGQSNYQKASKVVHELYSQLQAHRDPEQYLTKICDVLLRQDNQRLKDIANKIKLNYKCFVICDSTLLMLLLS